MDFFTWLLSLFGLADPAQGSASTLAPGVQPGALPPGAPRPGPGSTPAPGTVYGGGGGGVLDDAARTVKTAAGIATAVTGAGAALGIGGGGAAAGGAAAAGGGAAAAGGGGAAAAGGGAAAGGAGAAGGVGVAIAGAGVAIASVAIIGVAVVSGLMDDPVDDLHVADLKAAHDFDPVVRTYYTVKGTPVTVGGFRGTVFDEDSITVVADAQHPPGSPPAQGITGPYTISTSPRPKPAVAAVLPPRPLGTGGTIVTSR